LPRTLLVLVQLLQVVGGHGVDAAVLGTIDIVLVTENANGHVRAGNSGQLDGARETLVTLGVIVLEADLELDGLCARSVVSKSHCQTTRFNLEDGLTEEVALLGVVGVIKKLLNVRTHSGDCDLRHLDSLPVEYLILMVRIGVLMDGCRFSEMVWVEVQETVLYNATNFLWERGRNPTNSEPNSKRAHVTHHMHASTLNSDVNPVYASW
jgi:hypothetical protein